MESGDPRSAWQVQMGRRVGALPAVAAPVDDPRVCALLAQLGSAVEGIAMLDASTLTSEDRLALVCGAENTRRLLTGASHTWLNGLVAGSGFDSVLGAIGASGVPHALAHMLRITTAAAASRLAVARDLGTGTTMTGETLDPPLTHTAAAARDGALADAHVSIIRSFLKKLPHAVDAETRDAAEQTLADLARTVGPEELTAIATRLTEYLDPDGAEPDDRDRARKRFFEIDPQGPDSMSTGRFCVDPVLRALLDAFLAKFAAPGTNNSESTPSAVDLDDPPPKDDTTPTDAVPSGDAGQPADSAEGSDDREAEWDHRTPGQRNHDALTYLLKDVLASGRHGQHRGLPLSVVVSVSLDSSPPQRVSGSPPPDPQCPWQTWCAWRPRRTTTSASSTGPPAARCTSPEPAGARAPTSGSPCSPATAAAPGRNARPPRHGARPTMSTTGRRAA
nr:DUF222 domain-containing protein [Rhodococcus sp. MEB041]